MFIAGWATIIIECLLMWIFRIICGGNHYSRKRIRRCISVLKVFFSLNGFVAGWFLHRSIICFKIGFVILVAMSIVIQFINICEIKWLLTLTRINRNRRVYSPECLESAIKAYNDKGLDNVSFVGEIEHPKE